MPAAISPGVYVELQDNSLYTPAIAATLMGIVGTATRGPLNEATLITSEAQLVSTFGIPRAKDYGMWAAIGALKDARLVYFCRIAGASQDSGDVTIQDAGSDADPAQTPYSSTTETWDLEPDYTFVLTRNGPVTHTVTMRAVAALITAANTGNRNLNAIDGGNPVTFRVSFNGEPIQTITLQSSQFSSYAAATPAEIAAAINSQIIRGRATVAATAVRLTSDVRGSDSTVQVYAAASGGDANDATNGLNFSLTIASSAGPNDVADIDATTAAEIKTRVEAATSSNILVDINGSGAISFRTAATGVSATLLIEDTSTAIGASPLVNLATEVTYTGSSSGAPADTVTFTALTVGSHSADIQVVVTDSPSLEGTMKLVVKYRGVPVEVYDKMWKGAGTMPDGAYALVDTINDGETGVYTASDYITATDEDVAAGNPAAGTYTLSEGDDGDNWTASTVIGTIVVGVETGMQVFSNPEKIDVNILATPGISYASVISAALDLCIARNDCEYIADAPQGLTGEDATKWHNGDDSIGAVTVGPDARTETNSTAFNSRFGMLYHDWVKITNVYDADAATIEVPPTVLVLRSIAYNDQVAEQWSAIGGPNRTRATHILDLVSAPPLGMRDIMQAPGNNVNPIAKIPGPGIVIYGQKTLQRAPTALDRGNVQRLVLVAMKIVSKTVIFLTFEPNDAIMWRRFVNLTSPLFEYIKRQRGLYEFRVVADSSTTTGLLIDQNTMLGQVYLQPVKTAEKIRVPFNIVGNSVSFQDAIQA